MTSHAIATFCAQDHTPRPNLKRLLNETDIALFANLLLKLPEKIGFRPVPKSTETELIRELQSPHIDPKKINKSREPVNTLKQQEESVLLELVKRIYDFSEINDKLRKHLFRLDSRHYPIRNPINAPNGELFVHNCDHYQPYPENFESLIAILSLYNKGQEILDLIPDTECRTLMNLKKKVGLILNSPTLNCLKKERSALLNVIKENTNPFLLFGCKKDALRKFGQLADTLITEALNSEESEANTDLLELSKELESMWDRNSFMQSKAAKLRHFGENLLQHFTKLDIFVRTALQLQSGNYHFAMLSDSTGLDISDYRHPQISGEYVNSISLNFTSEEGGLLISGAVGSGRTTILHSALLATMTNQSGLPLPTSKPATLGVFSDFHAVFPRANQIGSGDGLFGTTLKRLPVKVEKGSLVILDSVPAGTDSEGVQAVGLTAVQHYLNSGATVIINSPSAKLSEAIIKTTDLKTCQTENPEKRDNPPSCRLTEGHVVRGQTFELATDLGFPAEVINYSLKLYRGLKSKDIKMDPEKVGLDPLFARSTFILPYKSRIRLLKRLEARYPERFFALKDTRVFLLRDLSGLTELVKRNNQPILHHNKGLGFKVSEKRNAEKAVARVNMIREMIKTFQAVDKQVREQLKESIRTLLEKATETHKLCWNWNFMNYDDAITKTQKAHKEFKEVLSRFIKNLRLCVSDDSERIQFFTKFLRPIEMPDQDSLNIYKKQQMEKEGETAILFHEYRNFYEAYFINELAEALREIDLYNAIASSSECFNYKEAIIEKNGPLISAQNILPIIPETDKDNTEIRLSKTEVPTLPPSPISFEVSSTIPQAILGPNSSGKSILIESLWLETYLAINGYPTSGDFRCSDFGEIYTFFGTNSPEVINSHYTMQAYKQISYILANAKTGDLVLLDELPGSDPEEIACLQQAIAKYAKDSGFLLIFNTHHREGLLEAIKNSDIVAWSTKKTISENPNAPDTYEVIPDPGLTSKSNPLAVVKEIWPDDIFRKVELG